jgi:hypothetical protein
MGSLASYFIRVVCNECGKRWKVRDTGRDPQCSRCNSVDIDIDPREEV